MKGVSEKFKQISNWYNIKTKHKNTFGNSVLKTRPEMILLQTVNCIYNIHCECSKSYGDKKGMLLCVWIQEHKHNPAEGLMES
jgi:hypothetical protein